MTGIYKSFCPFFSTSLHIHFNPSQNVSSQNVRGYSLLYRLPLNIIKIQPFFISKFIFDPNSYLMLNT